MGVRQIVDGDAVRILVPGALGLQVDGAAERGAAGRGTEQEGAGAVQYLDLVIEFGRAELAWRHAVETVDRDILAVQRETENKEQDRKSTRLKSSHKCASSMPSPA